MSYAEFWGAVVEQAAIDILRPEIAVPTDTERDNAIAWVKDVGCGMASYEWACDVAGIDAGILRRIMKERGLYKEST